MSGWNDFLQSAGAQTDTRFGRHFGDLTQEAAATAGTTLMDAGHLGVIGISGPDAETFLQGQLTCDVREVTETCFRLGAWCSVKGRVQTSFWLAKAGDQYLLIMDGSLLAPIQVALKKYILFSKATMTIRADLAILGWHGDTALLAQSGLVIPAAQATASNGATCILNLGDRLLILCSEGEAQRLWQLPVTKAAQNAW
ncbi:MAG TPA: hypothetical protein VFM46_03065, partial [Pseudomonadales bacterium]|nr:hypothetical protein [Pseudomonadales bacterium]